MASPNPAPPVAAEALSLAPGIIAAIQAEVAKQTSPGAWKAPSTYFFAAGTLLGGSTVLADAAQLGLSSTSQIALVSFAGTLVAIGGFLMSHGH